MPQFEIHNSSEQADALAAKMPSGKAWIDKYTADTNMRNLLIAYGLEFMRLEQGLNYTDDELSLVRTQDMILEWETEYGINKSCFADQNKSDLEQRIKNILVMIAGNGTNTSDQFEYIGSLFGINVVVKAGEESLTTFPVTFPFTFYNDILDARYTILVEFPDITTEAIFPHTFPFIFGDNSVLLLKCFFEVLKPSNCRIVYG